MSIKLIQISLYTDAFQPAEEMVSVASMVSFNDHYNEKEGTCKSYYD